MGNRSATEATHFRVDPRLAALLAGNYRSSEQALKELVDNAWDADAENVWITLPTSTPDSGIIVRDDGWGMTDDQIKQEYLSIARNRRTGGNKSKLKSRPIKGRKGIGKFAGFVAAEVMDVETRSQGKLTHIRMAKSDLHLSGQDLVEIDLPTEVTSCSRKERGTKITLTSLNGKLFLPNPSALKQILVLEYGRQRDFSIWVNDEKLAHEDLPGQSFAHSMTLPDGGVATLKLTILENNAKAAKYAGIVTRVGGKIVGKPGFFGLDKTDDIPAKILSRVIGEIETDVLDEDVTSMFGDIIENSTAYQFLQNEVRKFVSEKLNEACSREMEAATKRIQREADRRVERLPENRRKFAQTAVRTVLKRFWSESEEKIEVMVSLVLDAFEKDEYWVVCQNIEAARKGDVIAFAEALQNFGLLDMAMMAEQARRRLKLLDDLDELARNPATKEEEMHKPLANNLWVFGAEYSLMASNQTLARTIEEYTQQKFTGDRQNKRPDLFLAQNISNRFLLIEFKRPSHTIVRDDENQAEKYRDDLTPRFDTMDILVVGGKVDTPPAQYQRKDVRWMSYEAVFSIARTQLNWLIQQLCAKS